MKKTKTIAVVFAAAAALILFPKGNALTAEAEEPVSYAVQYDEGTGGWRMQANTNVFDNSVYSREIDYLQQDIKEGDIVVVYNHSNARKDLDLGNVRLSNLTVVQNTSFCVIRTGGVDECYVLGGSTCSINGNVKNAHVYNGAVCTFVNNVDDLTLHEEDSKVVVSVRGTVGHLGGSGFDLYDFVEDSLSIEKGTFWTDSSKYHTAEEHALLTPVSGGGPAATEQPQSAATDDEYDDVPKTGQNNLLHWLLLFAFASLAGSYLLRKTER